MHYVELFSGAGGGVLAHSVLGGSHLVAAAEKADYSKAVLAQRMAEGVLPPFALFDDVSTMDGKDFRGIDLLSGGFPCQGISAAGRKLGINDPRTQLIWQMLRMADESQAEYLFAENSDRLRGLLHLIVPELQRIGYFSVAWCVVGASDLGAYHRRKRMWLLAKRGGPPFIYSWPGAPKKNPACGMLQGSHLLPLTMGTMGVRKVAQGSLLPTLTCGDSRASGNRPEDNLWSLSDRLGVTKKASRLRQLPTLTATDWKSPWEGEGLEKALGKRSKPLRDMLPLHTPGKFINPVWGEWFMGWPMGWTALEGSMGEDVLRWKHAVIQDKWWSSTYERSALPATIMNRKSYPYQKERITALGNGQVPVVAHRTFEGLKGLLG